MAEKKRKVTDSSSSTAQATKKAKKASKNDIAEGQTSSEIPSSNVPVRATKRPRKRAADFLDDERDAPPAKPGQKPKPEIPTADGVNDTEEHSDDGGITITTTKKPKKKSVMVEAAQTQDRELGEEETNGDKSDDEEVDATPALLTGFDSDNDDPGQDKNFDASRVQPIPQFKKTSKKLRRAKEQKGDGPGVVYVGRIPHGFYEAQMREYFNQFGEIKRLRLSRNKKTGASKHFAFIEFGSDEVAKIVAETMDNYLMFGHILKCKYASEGSLHPEVWKGANKKFRKIPQHKLLKEQAEKPKTEEQMLKQMMKKQSKRERQVEKLKELGYDFKLPELKRPGAENVTDTGEVLKAIEDKGEGSVLPPRNEPKDEIVAKAEKTTNKQTKGKKSKTNEKVAVIESAIGPTPAKNDKQLKGILKKSTKA